MRRRHGSGALLGDRLRPNVHGESDGGDHSAKKSGFEDLLAMTGIRHAPEREPIEQGNTVR